MNQLIASNILAHRAQLKFNELAKDEALLERIKEKLIIAAEQGLTYITLSRDETLMIPFATLQWLKMQLADKDYAYHSDNDQGSFTISF